MSADVIEVLDGGLLTTVQDPTGRLGWRRYGVGQAGAVDALGARLANRLAGNADDAALLEVTLVGPRLRFGVGTTVGLAGADLGCRVDGMPFSPGSSRRVRGGAVVEFAGGSKRGARSYLAVAGGIDVSVVLGSTATDVRSGFGGFEGRPLRAGDRLRIGARSVAPELRRAEPAPTPVADADETIRVLSGPHAERFEPAAIENLCATKWHVSTAADRAGVRLEGNTLSARTPADAEVASLGVALGAIQVPPDGQPIVMLADRPATGGYPVLACVARCDVGRVAQLSPGDSVRFRIVSRSEALASLTEALAALERLVTDGTQDDAVMWAEAHN